MAARRTKRADGRYTVTLTIEGKKHFFYGRTQAEAKAKRDEARTRLAAGAPVRDASRTLSEWLTEWRETFLKASDRSESTKSLYDGLVSRHVLPLIGSLALGKIKPADVTRVMLDMEARGKSASTRRNTYAGLRGALDDAVANGLIAANPALKVKRPKVARDEARSLIPTEVKAFLNAAEGLRYLPALRLILMTGLRRGEALALRWQDIDLDRAEARVHGSLVRRGGMLVLSDTKTTNSRRTVSLSASALALLKAHKAAQNAERLKAANVWTDTGFVFTTEFGNPADPRNLLRAVNIASRRADLSEVGVHTLRHTFASTALMNGVPLVVVSRNLGHSSVAITGDIYGHLSDDASKDAAEKVSAALGM